MVERVLRGVVSGKRNRGETVYFSVELSFVGFLSYF